MSKIIEALRHAAGVDPDADAINGVHERLTRAELLRRVDEYTARLGDRQSAVIGLLADNGLDWVVADLAALAIGATLVPIPHFFTPSQVAHVIDDTAMDTLLVDDLRRLPEALAARLDACGRIGNLAVLKPAGRQPRAGKHAGPAKITFTSGSTGTPKGVCLAAECIEQVTDRLCTVLSDIGIDRHLCVLPLATLLENVAGVYVPLLSGTTIDALPLASVGLTGSSRMDGRALRAVIEQRAIGSLILQPQMLRELTAAATAWPMADSPLEYVAVGGARVAEADLVEARAAGIPAYQGYGLSECGSVVALNRPGQNRPGSVGRPLPGLDVSVAADGEILVRGQQMTGYLGGAACTTGEVSTGDLGHLDEDGFLYVTGRKKDLFITAYGRNVSPEWPESELVHEGAIAQACVFGEGRTTVTAVVVPAGSQTTRADVAAAVVRVNRRLPDYAAVGEVVISKVPFSPANGLLTATGKPKRNAIYARFIENAVDPETANVPGHATPRTLIASTEPEHDFF